MRHHSGSSNEEEYSPSDHHILQQQNSGDLNYPSEIEMTQNNNNNSSDIIDIHELLCSDASCDQLINNNNNNNKIRSSSNNSNNPTTIEYNFLSPELEFNNQSATKTPPQVFNSHNNRNLYQQIEPSKGIELALASEIEIPSPWIDVSVLAAKPLIPAAPLTSSCVALPIGVTSYVDLPFNINVADCSDYVNDVNDVNNSQVDDEDGNFTDANYEAELMMNDLLTTINENERQENVQQMVHNLQISKDNNDSGGNKTLKVSERKIFWSINPKCFESRYYFFYRYILDEIFCLRFNFLFCE